MIGANCMKVFAVTWMFHKADTQFKRDGTIAITGEMTVIRPIQDPQEATRELLKSKDSNDVYHTSKPEIVMEVVSRKEVSF